MTSLAVLLKESIERWADGQRQSSPLGSLAKSGQLPPRAVALYLESLRYLLRHSQRNLAHAAMCTAQSGNQELAEYFQRKAREERGHDSWATSDLARLPTGVAEGLQPAPSIVALVELQGRLIERHPVCFVAYALWAEYYTVLIGDEWLDALSRCGFDRSQVSAIAKHMDADREHAAAGFDEIDSLAKGQVAPAMILGAVEEAELIFEAFCAEICAEGQRAA